MRPEATFVAIYATALLAGALALHRLGRAKRSRPAHHHHQGDDLDPGWPHSEVPRFYTGIALVATGASISLSAGELLIDAHHPFETAVLTIVTALAIITASSLGRTFAGCPPSRR